MRNSVIKRTVKMASYALAVTLVLGGVALARDDDDYYRQGNSGQARQYGYQNGYNDGARHGREGRRHDPNDYQTSAWRQATHGYKNWMGPVNWYRRGYQEGYSNGFRSGYRNTGGWRDGDGDRDDRRSNDGWRGGYGSYGGGSLRNEAYRYGYDDGSIAARSDIEKRKSYNSKPRGRYEDRDHGYRREYGSRDQYKAEYTNGYRAGYDSAFRNRY
jgi:uncharacterized membrane protein